MNTVKETWRSFRGTVRGFDSPHQIALGVALGMIVGLIPKDSLLPYAIAFLVVLTPANLLSVLFSAIAFSFVSPLLDAGSHPIGMWVLNHEAVAPTWIWLYELPLVPWTRIENTVVVGSLILGVIASPIVYAISFQLAAKFGRPLADRLMNSRVAGWLLGPTTSPVQES